MHHARRRDLQHHPNAMEWLDETLARWGSFARSSVVLDDTSFRVFSESRIISIFHLSLFIIYHFSFGHFKEKTSPDE